MTAPSEGSSFDDKKASEDLPRRKKSRFAPPPTGAVNLVSGEGFSRSLGRRDRREEGVGGGSGGCLTDGDLVVIVVVVAVLVLLLLVVVVVLLFRLLCCFSRSCGVCLFLCDSSVCLNGVCHA